MANRDRPFARLPQLAGAGIVLVAGLVLVGGWELQLVGLTHVDSHWASLKANTAFGFILLGLVLVSRGSGAPRATLRMATEHVAAATVALLGCASLLEPLLGWDFGIDQLLAHDPYPVNYASAAGRMSMATAVDFLLLGVALCLPVRIPRRLNSMYLAERLALAAALVAYLELLGYANGLPVGQGPSAFTGMALHTALLFLVAALGAVFSRPESALAFAVRSPFAGGMITRRLMPLIAVMPVVLGIFKALVTRYHAVDPDLGWSLIVSFNAALVMSLAYYTATRLNRIEVVRTRAARKALADARRARELADAASLAKTEFVRNLSHEFRTPLNAILGFAELLLDQGVGAQERSQYVATILRSGRNLARLIDDVLDLAKVEAGKIVVEAMPVDIRAAVGEVAQMFLGQATDKRLGLRVEVGTEVPDTTLTDPARLRQILVNLVGNAVKFSHGGTVSLLVSTRRSAREAAAAAGDTRSVDSAGAAAWLVIRIKDQGVGMTLEQCSGLFTPFFQADHTTTRRFGGTGLGLSIARKMAQALGGDVALIASSVGCGTEFEATIALSPQPRVPPSPDLDTGLVFGCAGVTVSATAAVTAMATAVAGAAARARVAAQAPVTTGAMSNANTDAIGAAPANPNANPNAFATLDANGKTRAQHLADMRVLVVDDAADNRLLVERLLKRYGATVDLASGGQEAVDKGLAFAYAAILMDLQMPGMDGYEATWRLRRSGYVGPIVALSAHAMPEDKADAFRAGCSAHLSKPVDFAALLRTLQSYAVAAH